MCGPTWKMVSYSKMPMSRFNGGFWLLPFNSKRSATDWTTASGTLAAAVVPWRTREVVRRVRRKIVTIGRFADGAEQRRSMDWPSIEK